MPMSALRGIMFEMRTWARCFIPTSRYVAPYYPTPDHIVSRMLRVASVGAGDVVFDLGCGDGKVLLAALKAGATAAVGYELDPVLAARAAENIAAANASTAATVITADARLADVSTATVVTMYLSETGNRQLLAALRPSLKRGTRLVTYCFPVPGFEANLERIDTSENVSVFLYQYHGTDKSSDVSTLSSSSSKRGTAVEQ